MGIGHWALGIGHWALGKKELFAPCFPTPYFLKGNWGIIKNTDSYLIERFSYDSE
ncbi:hypothetical protein [[Scytonema hofmanni] UTEX B 1581]|uniref:hypothetical protein n=1 Tax=[Scytonema hofmanni] UTEX B 1581 TaxID=379535 RepID=UPI0016416A36|nr:hypothetical protein [[Scytonema hofmanni] UTEX B 1581]